MLNMRLPRLSVVIPTYECAKWLERAVRSTKTLIGCDLQVIVVDDGSTDATPGVLELLKREMPSLLTWRQQNGGLSSARNFGLGKACGDYVLFLDADDMLLPCDVAPLLESGSHMVRIGVEEVLEGHPTLVRSELPEKTSGREYLSRSFNANSFYTASCAYLYRVDWLRKKALFFEDGLLHEDNLFTVQALLSADTVQIVPTLLYRYIRRSDSITTASGDDKLLPRIQSYGRIAEHLTRIANSDRTFDLRWKIQEVLDGAQGLASQCTIRRGHVMALRSLLQFMFTYRGYGRHGFRLEQLKRIQKYLRSYLMHRPISRSEY